MFYFIKDMESKEVKTKVYLTCSKKLSIDQQIINNSSNLRNVPVI